MTFLIPASAILFGVLLMGETPEARHVAGMALIGSGFILIDGRPIAAPAASLNSRKAAPYGNG